MLDTVIVMINSNSGSAKRIQSRRATKSGTNDRAKVGAMLAVFRTFDGAKCNDLESITTGLAILDATQLQQHAMELLLNHHGVEFR